MKIYSECLIIMISIIFSAFKPWITVYVFTELLLLTLFQIKQRIRFLNHINTGDAQMHQQNVAAISSE